MNRVVKLIKNYLESEYGHRNIGQIPKVNL